MIRLTDLFLKLLLLSIVTCLNLDARGATCVGLNGEPFCNISGNPSEIRCTVGDPIKFKVKFYCNVFSTGILTSTPLPSGINSSLTDDSEVIGETNMYLTVSGGPDQVPDPNPYPVSFYADSSCGLLSTTTTFIISSSSAATASGSAKKVTDPQKGDKWVNVLKIIQSNENKPPMSFTIYRNNKLIKEVPNKGKKIRVKVGPNRHKNKVYVYNVCSRDPAGIESPPVEVIIQRK